MGSSLTPKKDDNEETEVQNSIGRRYLEEKLTPDNDGISCHSNSESSLPASQTVFITSVRHALQK